MVNSAFHPSEGDEISEWNSYNLDHNTSELYVLVQTRLATSKTKRDI